MFITLIFGKTFRNIITEQKKAAPYYKQDETVIQEIQKENVDYVSQLAFLRQEGFPFYRNTDFSFYSPCEEGFERMLKELKKAEKYIFMEYFIIEEGIMWNSILSILEEKVKQGVQGDGGLLFRTGCADLHCGDSKASYEYIMNIETRTSIS